jgi:uncharacterized protein
MNIGVKILLAVGAAGLLLPGAVAGQTAGKPALVNLSLGSVSSNSGIYAFAIGLSNVVRKHDPGLMVTAVEGGGGFDHAKLMKQGVLDWSISGSPSVAAAVTEGVDNFKKEGPWEPIRLMFMRNTSVSRIYVRADVAKKESIRGWSGLAGRKFSPGIPGTRDMTRAMEANRALGTGIRMVPGSMEDSMRGLREGALVGMLKGGPPNHMDAGMLECHYTTPLTVIGFTREEAQKLQALDPLNTFVETPAGGIVEIPELGALHEMSSPVMVISSSRMSQEIGYRIMKAVHRGWEEIASAYPPCRDVKPIEDAFAATPAGKDLRFHAGVVQFAREIGLTVPDRLVPAEYRPVK